MSTLLLFGRRLRRRCDTSAVGGRGLGSCARVRLFFLLPRFFFVLLSHLLLPSKLVFLGIFLPSLGPIGFGEHMIETRTKIEVDRAAWTISSLGIGGADRFVLGRQLGHLEGNLAVTGIGIVLDEIVDELNPAIRSIDGYALDQNRNELFGHRHGLTSQSTSTVAMSLAQAGQGLAGLLLGGRTRNAVDRPLLRLGTGLGFVAIGVGSALGCCVRVLLLGLLQQRIAGFLPLDAKFVGLLVGAVLTTAAFRHFKNTGIDFFLDLGREVAVRLEIDGAVVHILRRVLDLIPCLLGDFLGVADLHLDLSQPIGIAVKIVYPLLDRNIALVGKILLGRWSGAFEQKHLCVGLPLISLCDGLECLLGGNNVRRLA
mmetsp:Transcript_28914/g.83953  ORF Transcript_28914/g.83953 Transcript_28914/m.83953 type:complete len:371 (+) Transcript_28914:53-1165(+)